MGVVIKHEPLRIFFDQSIDPLLIATRSERDGDEGPASRPVGTVPNRAHTATGRLRKVIARNVLLSRPSDRTPTKDRIANNAFFELMPGLRKCVQRWSTLGPLGLE